MNKTLKDFADRYCMLYDIREDDVTVDDVLFIETVYWEYEEHGTLPDYMTKVGIIDGN